MRTIAAFAALFLLLAAPPAPARELDGIQVPDTLALKGAKQPLVLNGAGYRTRLFVKVYVGALYAVHPIHRVDTLLDATTPRVMRLQFVREVSADKLAAGWRDGFAANHNSFEMQALNGRLSQFNALFRDVKPNDVIRLDLLPRGETRVWINDAQRGSVDGVDFQRALLKVWLGEKPADADLKQALLGGKG